MRLTSPRDLCYTRRVMGKASRYPNDGALQRDDRVGGPNLLSVEAKTGGS